MREKTFKAIRAEDLGLQPDLFEGPAVPVLKVRDAQSPLDLPRDPHAKESDWQPAVNSANDVNRREAARTQLSTLVAYAVGVVLLFIVALIVFERFHHVLFE